MTTSAEFLKEKEVVAWLSEIPTEGTRDTYSSALCRYWTEDVSKRFPALKDWVEAVKVQRKSDDMMTRKTWARELISYMNSSMTKLTNRKMSTDYKSITAAAVKSFLRALADEELDYDFKFKETDEEIADENKPAMTIEEVRKLYEAAQKTRDKALLLVAINGVAPAEMVQFTQTWKKWWPKDITQLKAPFKVSLVRHKAHFPYHVTLWQDAVEALKALYAEQAQKTGGSVDHLFVMDNGKPFTRGAYDFLWDRLRQRAGLYLPAVAYEAQRVHAHGVRHFFETQAKLHRVAQDVVEFSVGHKGEQYGYDKSHLEEQWCGIVEKELGKMTDVLNLKTGAAQKYYESKEEEIRIKAMRDFYNTLLKTNALKPETMDVKTLDVICRACGVDVSRLLMQEFREFHVMADIEVERRLAIFDQLATAVNLDSETKAKYLENLRVMKPTNAKAAWENHVYYWLRCEAGGDDFMQALADGFEVVDKEGSMRILRKPK